MKRRSVIRGLGLVGLGLVGIGQAQSTTGHAIVLSGNEIVPTTVDTPALAVVRIETDGRVIHIRGAVANLSGAFRDYTRDPVDDPALNARLTSAIHLHRGPKGQNGPLLQALKAVYSSDGRSAIFVDRLELSAEDQARLRQGELYFDIHTALFRAGEIRGQILL
ncbi:MAG: CHRD domain-containing protein [Meiothermus sp.]|nr:CHRD domain-containing protein [Meiothermus sp.]